MNASQKAFIDTLISRRSIRRYTDETIDEADLHMILTAGQSAPSAHNLRPLHLVVIRDRAVLNLLSEKNNHAWMLARAPLAIAVIADRDIQPVKDLYIDDGAAAIENMLLAAHGLGLGGVWMGVIHLQGWYEEIRHTLNLTERMMPIGIIAIGHPAEVKTTGDRYIPERVHQEKL